MNRLKYVDKLLLISSLLLFGIGLVMVFSASNVAAFMRYNSNPYKIAIKQALFLGVGVLASLAILKIKNKTFYALDRILLAVTIVSLVLIFKLGVTINGAASWYSFFNIANLQPSEFIKVIMIIWMADFYERKSELLNKYTTSLIPIGIAIIAAVLIILQPDFGTALIYLSIVAFMFFTSKVSPDIKKKMFLLAAGIITLGAIILLSMGTESKYMRTVMDRFNYNNPCSEEKFYDKGNQVCNGYIAFNNGGLLGKGLGNSTQKYLYLPEAHTDFIFAIIVEELGVVFGVFVLLLYFLIISRIIIIGKNSYSNRNALLCYGVAFYLILHIVINLTGVLGILPLTGVPLPFLSYGGSFLVSTVISLAVVQKISIENNLRKKAS